VEVFRSARRSWRSPQGATDIRVSDALTSVRLPALIQNRSSATGACARPPRRDPRLRAPTRPCRDCQSCSATLGSSAAAGKA